MWIHDFVENETCVNFKLDCDLAFHYQDKIIQAKNICTTFLLQSLFEICSVKPKLYPVFGDKL